jgi:hypothetical protein
MMDLFDDFLDNLKENEIDMQLKIKNNVIRVNGDGVTFHVGRSSNNQSIKNFENKEERVLLLEAKSDENN